jgi:hypothetical protein
MTMTTLTSTAAVEIAREMWGSVRAAAIGVSGATIASVAFGYDADSDTLRWHGESNTRNVAARVTSVGSYLLARDTDSAEVVAARVEATLRDRAGSVHLRSEQPAQIARIEWTRID